MAIRWRRIAHVTIVLGLGLVLPLLLMLQAYLAVSGLDGRLELSTQIENVAKSMPEPTREFKSPNDYALYSLALVESNNFRGLANKQRMKIAVINVGFAIASVGLLFLVFGVDQGGLEASGGGGSVPAVNLKIASTGLAVFVFGATLSGAGGLLPNQYTTAGVPGYVAMAPAAKLLGQIKQEQVVACVQHTADEQQMNLCLQKIMTN